jgi:hypothetical protein
LRAGDRTATELSATDITSRSDDEGARLRLPRKVEEPSPVSRRCDEETAEPESNLCNSELTIGLRNEKPSDLGKERTGGWEINFPLLQEVRTDRGIGRRVTTTIISKD